jgi:hypothetical protein
VDADSPELDPPDVDAPELDPPEAGSPEPELPDPEPEPPDGGPPALDPADAGSPDFAPPLAFFVAAAAEDRRSFLAQPLPLKWIVGGTNARVTAPSQRGHW